MFELEQVTVESYVQNKKRLINNKKSDCNQKLLVLDSYQPDLLQVNENNYLNIFDIGESLKIATPCQIGSKIHKVKHYEYYFQGEVDYEFGKNGKLYLTSAERNIAADFFNLSTKGTLEYHSNSIFPKNKRIDYLYFGNRYCYLLVEDSCYKVRYDLESCDLIFLLNIYKPRFSSSTEILDAETETVLKAPSPRSTSSISLEIIILFS
jgi:hypothetical protein